MSEVVNKEYIQEDEIDLRELFSTIWKHKIKIVLFSFIVVCATLIYALSIPNSYRSSVVLSPQGDDGKSSLGGLGSLAGLAGISLGGGSSKDPMTMMQTVLKDYEFNSYMIKKYDLIEKINKPSNLVFALGFDSLYSVPEIDEEKTQDELIYDTNLALSKILSISSDKDSGLITFSAEYIDRFLAKELVDIYLKEIIEKIKIQDMKEIEKQITYYQKELSSTYDVSLKEQLSKSISSLMQKRVFSQANDYYFVSKLVDSRVAYIKEKTKPKRALILVVSFVTSIILGIFMVFFYEFIKGNKKDEKTI
ncbi:LPS biosynthesis protein [Malaciobacter pacificus]|uniref:Putative chain length determinant protein, Wzz family n=1 Tax=Malaciobacter pacificus TaxID=1080223 RepID=A0A5C2H4I2_9BACT|nr:Wzz/FepE/Etk N-terminal domain-containing protein [Malaciobacter pacificus]QEP33861.1 putative chain length determinant protein, Wzz family [Malaciobacter pacificus]GGD34918.1 LPS biosynthesis protein [Malaciobacter pacificus]